MRSFFSPQETRNRDVKKPIHLSKKHFSKADAMPYGQIIRQGNIVPGGCKGRATEKKVLQSHVQKGGMFPLVNRPLGFEMLAHVGTPVGDIALGG